MRYLTLLLPMLLFGCADSSTTGSIREYNIEVSIHDNWGPVTLEFPLSVDATSSTDQTTEGQASISPDIRLQLTEGAATGAMSGADSLIKDVVSKYQPMIKKEAEKQVIEQLPVTPPATPIEPTSPLVDPPTEIPPADEYETYFLNTQTDSPEGGKVLALCPGDTRRFDKCTAGGVNLPFHRLYNGGSLYWNMKEAPKGDIICVLNGKEYLYPATNNDHRGRVTGSCKKPTAEILSKRVEEQIEAQKPEPTSPLVDPPLFDDLRTETGTYHGRHNGDRPTWYFTKDLAQYPTPIMVDIPGCFENRIIEHDGVRYDLAGLILKQSDVPGRHMAMVAPAACQSQTATITY